MDNTTKKGIRYSDEQKKEVVDYAIQYNAENGRGGQSKAAEKFGVSQLTVSNWMKGAGGSQPKSGKGRKAGKAAKKTGKKGTRKSRFSDEQKQEVLDFVLSHNQEHGRGGQSKAAEKFGITPLTIMTWLKASGGSSKKKATKRAGGTAAKGKGAGSSSSSSSSSAGSDMSGKLNRLLELSNRIAETEAELADLREEFEAAKAAL